MSQDFARHMEMPQAHRKAYIQVNTMLLSEAHDKYPSMHQITEIEAINDNIPDRHLVVLWQQWDATQRHVVSQESSILCRHSAAF